MDPSATKQTVDILGLILDLLFKSKIQEVAQRLQYEARFETNPLQFFELYRKYIPKLIFVDLTLNGIDFNRFFRDFYEEVVRETTRVVAYTTHADWKKTEPYHGYCDQVVTKNVLVQNLPNLILGYVQR